SLVRASGRYARTIWAERRRVDSFTVSHCLADLLAGLDIPQPSSLVIACSHNTPSVRRVRNLPDCALMFHCLSEYEAGLGIPQPSGLFIDRGPGFRIPQAGRLVIASGHDASSIRAERHGVDSLSMWHRLADWGAGLGIPQSSSLVIASGHN